ncbi:MAG: hypothetical protein IT463_09315 [Planctomycetes bacterium]|nr:hypothetical protein [Planctomycetota bacterium]
MLFIFKLWDTTDQVESLGCTTDENGDLTGVNDFGPFGEIYPHPVYKDVARLDITGVSANTPVSGVTCITLNETLSDWSLAGKELAVAIPGDGSDTYRVGRILDSFGNELWVLDSGTYTIASALWSGSAALRGFVVYDFQGPVETQKVFTVLSAVFNAGQTMVTAAENVFLGSEIGWTSGSAGPDLPVIGVLAPNVLVFSDDVTMYFPEDYTVVATRPESPTPATTGGEWTGVQLEIAGLGDHTLLTCDGADFRSYMAGWSLCLDAEKPSWFTVDVVVLATQLRLYLKNATTLTAVGRTFRLCPPPFVDAQTGTLGSRDASGNVTFAHAKTQAARLWAGYRYTPPLWLTFRRYFVIGVSSSGSIHQRSLTAMWSTNPPCQNTWPDS